MIYDYLIVGAGLYGAVCARILTDNGYRCLVVERREHIGGNCYTEMTEGIMVHKYGAHIFHTNSDEAWEFVNRFAKFMPYCHTPVANFNGEIYNLPFNMNTFAKLWNVSVPEEAKQMIAAQATVPKDGLKPETVEELAMQTVGKDIYEKLVQGYTEKQWGKKCSELPAEILGRIPLRFVYDNNYFDAKYQGIPERGYTDMIQQMLRGIDVVTGVDFLEHKCVFEGMSRRTIFTGAIDAYFNYSAGELEWRSLRFEHSVLDKQDYQGVSVMNFTDSETPHTRIIEHRHFDKNCTSNKTVITREFPVRWECRSQEKYYPVDDKKNRETIQAYRQLAMADKRTVFCGRLGEYAYIDMDQTVLRAIHKANLLSEVDRVRY